MISLLDRSQEKEKQSRSSKDPTAGFSTLTGKDTGTDDIFLLLKFIYREKHWNLTIETEPT